jgi:glycosyltransferase involved in cell wall biosynthesis
MEYDFCVLITTYNRPEMLNKLLDDIGNNKKDYKVLVAVFDDGSTQKLDLTGRDVIKIGMYPNMGKKKYYVTYNATFSFVRTVNSKYFIYLPDDISLENDFFDKCKRLYESITDNNKICLSILTDDRVNRSHWGYSNPNDLGEILQTQWNDLCFICEKNFFELLDYKVNPISAKRWINNPQISSGVGHQITQRLNNYGKSLYHVKKSLVYHGVHESKMNKNEREENNLITI